MRQHLGTITTNEFRQTHPDPGKESLRQALIRDFRLRKAERDTQAHIEELTGKKEISKAILSLFDEKGRPPPHITIDDLVRQYDSLKGQRKWVAAIHEELHRKLENIDPERYEEERKAKEAREREHLLKKEAIFAQHIEKKEEIKNPRLLELLRKALQKSRRAGELHQYVKRDMEDGRIIGVRQIERALIYLFAEYGSNKALAAEDHAPVRYDVMKKEADWLDVTMAEIDGKLVLLQEVIESGKVYLKDY